jgi:Na+-driven multidrug efflux pump
VSVASQSILILYTTVSFVMVPLAISIAVSVRVSQLLASQNSEGMNYLTRLKYGRSINLVSVRVCVHVYVRTCVLVYVCVYVNVYMYVSQIPLISMYFCLYPAAKTSAFTSLLLATLLCGAWSYLFYFFRNYLGYMFTSDVDVIHRCSQLAGIFSLLQFINGMQGVAQGVMRAMSRQKELFGFTFFCYWMFGLPLGRYVDFIYIFLILLLYTACIFYFLSVYVNF